jgi:hypothetical protein
MKVYLAGPIELIGPERARRWREEAIRVCDGVFTSLEPINPMDYEPEEGPFHDEEVVNTDQFLLRTADAILVDGRTPGWGTAMEVLQANQQSKLVVVWGIERDRASIWLRYHATHFELTLTGALEHLYAMAGAS